MKQSTWILFIALIINCIHVFGQKVPTYMNFADIKLKITDAAKREIQKDVDMLTRSPRHHKIKADRAKLYFPVIEKTFREEGLPDDFKFLVLQESALIPDAVSTSNAVGFWQFKKEAAKEMGLRVDGVVDERMNIVSASRGAARYLKKYNNLFFNNWLYMLQAYQMGPGGALRSLDKKNKGAKRMVIDKKTYWYVKKYLAHKIAFEQAVDHRSHPVKLAELNDQANNSLKNIAREYQVDLEQIKTYNKWLKGRKIPGDKSYTIVIPVENDNRKLLAKVNQGFENNNSERSVNSKKSATVYTSKSVDYNMGMDYPKVRKKILRKSGLSYTVINGLPGVVARKNTSIAQLAEGGGISVEKFRVYNDITKFDKVIPGQVYYFKRKKSKAGIHFYAAKRNESLWSISQKFGLKLNKLMQKNRMINENNFRAGHILWLRFVRPSDESVEYIKLPEEDQQKPLHDPVKNPVVIHKNVVEKKPALENQKYPVQSDRTTEKQLAKVPEEKATGSIATTVNDGDENWGNDEMDTKWVDNDGENSQSWSIKNQPVDKPVDRNENKAIQPVIDRKNPSPTDEFQSTDTPSFIQISEPSAFAENGKKIHVIKQGETLFSIARTYNITVNDLKAWNNLDNPGNIKFDQKIVVGILTDRKENLEVGKLQDAKNRIILHEVQEGETMSSISRSYRISLQKLMKLNDKTDYKISIGEKLKVLKGD